MKKKVIVIDDSRSARQQVALSGAPQKRTRRPWAWAFVTMLFKRAAWSSGNLPCPRHPKLGDQLSLIHGTKSGGASVASSAKVPS